jgi:hypothetical protein
MLSRISALFVALIVMSTGLLIFNSSHTGYAFDFEPRSITLSTGTPSAVASHNFVLAPPTTSNIGSLVFEYCANSPISFAACTPPPGLDASSATLVSQSGNTGFSINTPVSTANKIVLGRTSAPGIITNSTYNFDNIINPSTPGETVYVRLGSFSSSDGSGPLIDKGAVAFAVQSTFSVNTFVPPFLKLCVGISVAPDCSLITGDSIDLGDLSSQHANAGQSQFATGTNDPNGYVIFALGNTMTSGNNTISALAAPSASFPGTQQFGINLRANLLPAVGQDPIGLGTGAPAANYNVPNRFMFNSGDTITSSPLTTDYNRMTVSYLVNVPNKQPPGVYATTITYVATVQF